MNKSEGAVYAAKAKSGQIGNLLFKETKPSKTKKFGYKKRTQTFPLRKVATGQDSESENHQAQGRTSSQRNLSATSRGTNSQTDNKKDFVKRNVQKISGKTKEEMKDANTIALTQDQLNAILKTIGQITSTDSIASVTVENEDVKVSTSGKKSPQCKPNYTNKPDAKAGAAGKSDTEKEENSESTTTKGSENILAFLAKTLAKPPSPVPRAKSTSPNEAPEIPNKNSASKSPKKEPKRSMENQTRDDTVESPKARDAGQSGKTEIEDTNRVGFAHLSLAERKRRKWKEELDEQAKLKQQQAAQDTHFREIIASRVAMAHSGTTQTLNQGQTGTRQTQAKNMDDGEKFSPDNSPRGVAPSSLGVIATQRVVPAAMRSSFLIGGQGSAGSRLIDHNAQVKRRQQQEWLQELEKQRIEALERKQWEKQSQREYESGLAQQWAEPVNPPPNTRQPVGGHKPHVQDDTAVQTQTERQGEVGQPRSAPPQGTDIEDGVTAAESRSHVRAYNLLLDPAEIERKEAQRHKHLEHMLAVKAQVEEKQRLKKEAEERRRQEEMEEEWRLAQQRRDLQEQFESEKDKQKRKQEEEAARHRALVESMQTAYQEAQQDKHRKRLEKLAKMGHDTSNLRHSLENGQELSHEPVSQTSYKAPPRVDQPTVPQAVQHSPRHVMDQVTSQVAETPVMMVDAFTSPVYDQAVQTEFHFTPHEDVSIHDGHLEREASAHIEYKPDVRPGNKESGRKEKIHKTQGRKMKTVKEETQEGAVRGVRQTGQLSRTSSLGSEQENPRRNMEKPVWGANTKNKKPQRNSDKDLTISKQKREERRRQRAAELLAEQERNAPGRLVKGNKPKSTFQDKQWDSVHSTGATRSRPKTETRNHDHTDHQGRNKSIYDRAPSQTRRDRYGNLPDTPPLKNGDFVPFLRSDEPLMSEDRVPVTPESRQMQRQRKPMKTVVAGDREDNEDRREDTIRLHAHTEKDPLLNPDRLKDTGHRQERILQQLSHLRQGLMMKQREMEITLNTPAMM